MIHVLSALTVLCTASFGQIPTLTDVPPGHWARAAVADVVAKGIMGAPRGRFDGARKVSRGELLVSLARYAKALEKGAWNPAAARPVHSDSSSGKSLEGGVSRYELAAVLSRMAPMAAAGIPKAGARTFGRSEALPDQPRIALAQSDAAYPALRYLTRNRMIPARSPIALGGKQPVTGRQVASAVAAVIAGVNDRLTDEPQNREEIAPPPKHTHPK